MKTLIHQGQQFPVIEGDGLSCYIKIEIASPKGIEYIPVQALIDTGATGSTITSALMERLGLDDVMPYLGDQVTETANGTIKEPTTQVNLRVTGTDGRVTSFQDWPMTISASMSAPIFGMDILQYYSTQIKHGQFVQLVFDENSPGAIQKRQATSK